MLQSLDNTVFRWINQSLANPVCDWLMPALSDKRNFFPVAILAGVALIWKGGARGLVCVAMLILISPLADGLITNHAKKAIGRARPFVALEGVRLPAAQREDSSEETPRNPHAPPPPA